MALKKLDQRLRHAGLDRDAFMRPLFALLALAVAPFVWSVLGLLISLLSPVHGVLGLVAKIVEVLSEGREQLTDVREGKYFHELFTLYALALYAGLAAAALTGVVAGVAYMSGRVPRGRAVPFEIAAALVWAVPYWIYRIAVSLFGVGLVVGLVVAFVMVLIATIKSSGIIVALFGAVFVAGILALGAPAAYIGFLIAYGPAYLLLRYVVSLGLVYAPRDGFANRALKRAFAEGGHFPFGPPGGG